MNLATDIETASGTYQTAWVFAVGFAIVGRRSGTLFDKRRFMIEVGEGIPAENFCVEWAAQGGVPMELVAIVGTRERAELFEPWTWYDFWSKNTGALRTLFTVSEEHPFLLHLPGWMQVGAYIEQVYSDYREGGVTLVSDCPDFDIAYVNARRREPGGALARKDMRFSADEPTRRHWVVDPSEQLDGIARVDPILAQSIKDEARARAPHTHLPEDDAHHHAITQFLIETMCLNNKRRC